MILFLLHSILSARFFFWVKSQPRRPRRTAANQFQRGQMRWFALTRQTRLPTVFRSAKKESLGLEEEDLCVCFFLKRIVPWEIILFRHHLGIFLKLFFQTTEQANLNFCLEFVLRELHYVQSQNPEGQNGTRNGPISQLSEKLDIEVLELPSLKLTACPRK